MSIFAGKKGHHKKGHYDDEHKGHKGNNCMKILCKKFPRNKLLDFFSYFRQERSWQALRTRWSLPQKRRKERRPQKGIWEKGSLIVTVHWKLKCQCSIRINWNSLHFCYSMLTYSIFCIYSLFRDVDRFDSREICILKINK